MGKTVKLFIAPEWLSSGCISEELDFSHKHSEEANSSSGRAGCHETPPFGLWSQFCAGQPQLL